MLNQLANFTASQSHLNLQPNISQAAPLFQQDTNTILQEAMQSIRQSHTNGHYEQQVYSQATHPMSSSTGSSDVPVVLSDNVSRSLEQGQSLSQHLPVVLSSSVTENGHIVVPASSTESRVQQPLVQGYPVLLQPTGPGGPLQLIPLDKGVNTEVLKEIVERNISSVAQRSHSPSEATTGWFMMCPVYAGFLFKKDFNP